MPLKLCTPATIDFAVKFFINSMEIGGTVWGVSLPYFKKNKKQKKKDGSIGFQKQ